jgi:hypothetical protein
MDKNMSRLVIEEDTEIENEHVRSQPSLTDLTNANRDHYHN